MFSLPGNPGNFIEAEYWENLYSKSNDFFEWYSEYDFLKKAILEKHFKAGKKLKLLDVGCGRSSFPSKIAEAYPNIEVTAIDLSGKLIDQLSKEFPKIKYIRMDATKMNFGDAEFDIILDKATLDTLSCDDKSCDKAKLMLSEVHRVLRPGGQYFCITLAEPFALMTWLNSMAQNDCALKIQCDSRKSLSKYPFFILIAKKCLQQSSMVPSVEWSDGLDGDTISSNVEIDEVPNLIKSYQ